ncbi:SDR family oxidoreductase [Diaminobutyricimonas sp. TR449]|uniref:SDR family NAD(P)-dependent oxidoreductase n=1 Tax=Diaminobutyricimonas sp. TR449 TaxID=2708076 RepID=UPI00141D8F80|nr:SDR family oxidoreductase [Diaminobutyricimonas sp. TR449]
MTAPIDAPVALISGGTSGIGLASARRLASAGFVVVVGGRSEERLSEARASLVEIDARASALPLDVSSDDSCRSVVARVLDDHGRLDVLVNSVGSAPAGTIDQVDDAGWTAALDSKVLGSVRLMRAVIPVMTERSSGRIVNIAGTAGREPDPWMAVAGAANAALISVTKAASLQLAEFGITVNAVCPGPTRTGRWDGLASTYARINAVPVDEARAALEARIPAGRPADPDEIASLVAYLASEDARHITGTAIAVDGGQSRSI